MPTYATSRVIPGPDSLFELPEIRSLLGNELGLLPVHAARQPAGRALLLQPGPAAAAMAADGRHLAMTRVHVAGDLLRGDVVCAPQALPWEDESFQLVLAQHVGDALAGDGAIVEELARVMAPGSLLLWFGFNPWSPYLVWMHWRARRAALPQIWHADALRRRLQRAQLAPVAFDYLGTLWPHREAAPAGSESAERAGWLAPFRGTYLVVARKQRAVLTPLRPRVPRKAVALGSRLAGTPTHRACA